MLRIRDKDIVAAREQLIAASQGRSDWLPWETVLAKSSPKFWALLHKAMGVRLLITPFGVIGYDFEHRRILSALAMVFGPVYYAKGESLPRLRADDARAIRQRGAEEEQILARLARLHARLAAQFRLAVNKWFPDRELPRHVVFRSVELLLEALEKEGGKK